MKPWLAIVIAVILLLLTPWFWLGISTSVVLTWLWFTYYVIESGRVDFNWIILGLVAEIISPDFFGLAVTSWGLYLLIINFWVKKLPPSDQIFSQIFFGIVSATSYIFSQALRLLGLSQLHGHLFDLFEQWLWLQVSWLALICLNRLIRRYALS